MPSPLPAGTKRTPDCPQCASPSPRPDIDEMLSDLADLAHMRNSSYWVPGNRIQRLRCGSHFDAVRIPAVLGASALDLLGPGTGPVIGNDLAQIWYFLLRPGLLEPGRWEMSGIRVLRHGTLIAVPPHGVTKGHDVRWVVPPGTGVTSVPALVEALAGRNPARAMGTTPLLSTRPGLQEPGQPAALRGSVELS